MPIVSGFCTAFIELWRGVPLISVLFMALVMLPLFLPEGVNFDKLVRAIVGVIILPQALKIAIPGIVAFSSRCSRTRPWWRS